MGRPIDTITISVLRMTPDRRHVYRSTLGPMIFRFDRRRTVYEFKKHIGSCVGRLPERLRLVYGRRHLGDDRTLASYGIVNENETVRMFTAL